MIFADLLALAKAGYTPADVREFLAAETKSDKETPSDGSEDDAPDEKTDTTTVNVSRETLNQDPQKSTEEPEAIDYKAQYEAAMDALKKAQAANTKQKQPEPEDNNKILMDAVAQFM